MDSSSYGDLWELCSRLPQIVKGRKCVRRLGGSWRLFRRRSLRLWCELCRRRDSSRVGLDVWINRADTTIYFSKRTPFCFGADLDGLSDFQAIPLPTVIARFATTSETRRTSGWIRSSRTLILNRHKRRKPNCSRSACFCRANSPASANRRNFRWRPALLKLAQVRVSH
jgi:hypothetical protein